MIFFADILNLLVTLSGPSIEHTRELKSNYNVLSWPDVKAKTERFKRVYNLGKCSNLTTWKESKREDVRVLMRMWVSACMYITPTYTQAS